MTSILLYYHYVIVTPVFFPFFFFFVLFLFFFKRLNDILSLLADTRFVRGDTPPAGHIYDLSRFRIDSGDAETHMTRSCGGVVVLCALQ